MARPLLGDLFQPCYARLRDESCSRASSPNGYVQRPAPRCGSTRRPSPLEHPRGLKELESSLRVVERPSGAPRATWRTPTMEKTREPRTVAASNGVAADRTFSAVAPPIYLTSTFAFAGYERSLGHEYTRTSNPTRD